MNTKEFKETEIGKIPKDWKIVSLESLVKEIRNGFACGKRDPNGIAQIRMNNVSTDGSLILENYLKVPAPQNIKDWIIKEGDFLFNNTNSYDLVGKSTVFRNVTFPCTFSNHFTRMRFKNYLVLPEIILYHFIILWKKGYFKSVAIRHVGQSAVHNKYLLKLKLPLPPLHEQKKISEIFSTVDKSIEKVNEAIAKTERLKKGLMQELLTKGIGHKEFKETEIGKIPKAWRVIKMANVGLFVNGFGFPTEYQGKRDEEYIFVKVSDTNLIGNEKYILATKNTIDDKLAKKIGVKIYPPDTIIFPKIGMVIYLRKVRILAKAGTFDNNIMGITPYKDIIDAEFLFYYFLEKIDLTKLCGRTTAPSIRKSEVEKLSITLPPLHEQKKIAEILSAIDERIQLLKEKNNKLERIKKGLMNDLLIGKKRVKVDFKLGG